MPIPKTVFFLSFLNYLMFCTSTRYHATYVIRAVYGTNSIVCHFQAEFFWEHNGEATGEHTGFIHFWIRNRQAQAPSTVRRKRKSASSFTRDESDAMDELLELDETADYSIVEQLMQTTFQYREGLRNRNTSCTEILNQFPYFLYYDGKLVIIIFHLFISTGTELILGGHIAVAVNGQLFSKVMLKFVGSNPTGRGFLSRPILDNFSSCLLCDIRIQKWPNVKESTQLITVQVLIKVLC